MIKKLISTFSTLLLSSSFALAQVSTDLTLKTSPLYPNPSETFVATVETYAINLDKSDVYWLINDVVVASGFGKKQVTLKAPEAGKGYRLTVTAKSPGGKTYTYEKTFLSSSVSIVWEATDSYVPDWYEGRALLPEGGKIRIFAMPNIGEGKIASKDIVFNWTLNNESLLQSSGLGKNYLDYRISEEQGDDLNFELEVSPVNSNEKIVRRFSLSPNAPELIIYKDSSLYGTLSQQAYLGTIPETETEFSLMAEPFFSSGKQTFKDLRVNWTVNGVLTGKGDSFKKLFRIPSPALGISNITVSFENINKLLQDAKTSFSLSF
jgi:hypothetical protein